MAHIKHRCTECRRVATIDPKARECPHCGAELPDLLRTPASVQKPPPVGRKKFIRSTVKGTARRRRKKRVEIPMSVVGQLKRTRTGWRLRVLTDGTETIVSVGGPVDPEFLEGHAMRFRFEPADGPVQRVAPVGGADLDRAMHEQFLAERRAHDRGVLDLRIGPFAPDESQLERSTANLTEKAREIKRLATYRDDPYAWSEIMNAYRVEALRSAIQDALRGIGCEQALSLALRHPADGERIWPSGLIEWLQAEVAKEAEQRVKASRMPKSYDDNDYGIADI